MTPTERQQLRDAGLSDKVIAGLEGMGATIIFDGERKATPVVTEKQQGGGGSSNPLPRTAHG